jgi:hypothetical protein
MAGSNRMELAKKAFKQFNQIELGVERLKHIVRMRLTSDENKVFTYLKTMRSVGMLTETTPSHFLVNTDIDLYNSEVLIEDTFKEETI